MTTTGTSPSLLDSSLYIPELKSRRRDAVLTEMVGAAGAAEAIRARDPLIEVLQLRERVATTAVGKGVALPNARSLAVRRPLTILARSRRGVDWGAADGQAVQLVLLTLTPAEWTLAAHHGLVGRAAALVRLQRQRQRLLGAETSDTVTALFGEVVTS